jgi:predicted transcriptional regulator
MMYCSKDLRLTPRDLKVPELVKDYTYLTTNQIAELLYPSKQKAQTRLLKVYKSGLVKRFVFPVLIVDGGRGEFVYHLTRLPKVSFSKLAHTIKLNNIRIAFEKGCLNTGTVDLEAFVPEYSVKSISMALNANMDDSRVDAKAKHIIPDGVMCLKNRANGKKALFFIELDLGTEKIKTSTPKEYSLVEKMLVYKEWMKLREYDKYSEKFGYSFKGFRVLVIMNSQIRKRKLRNELSKHGIKQFIYLTDCAKIVNGKIFDRIWSRCDFRDEGKYSIIE